MLINKILFKKAAIAAFFIFYYSNFTFSQIKEYGFGLVNGAYKGSLNYNSPSFFQLNPGINLFYRHNKNEFIVFRPQFCFTSLSYSDKSNYNPLNQKRNLSFKSNVLDLDFLVEYNFIDFRGKNERIHWTPYLVGGLGGFLTSIKSYGTIIKMGVCMPVGLGIKFQVSKKANFGLEFLAKKSFMDKFDNVTNYPKINDPNEYQGGDANYKDWYYATSLWLSYTLYEVNCPTNHPK